MPISQRRQLRLREDSLRSPSVSQRVSQSGVRPGHQGFYCPRPDGCGRRWTVEGIKGGHRQDGRDPTVGEESSGSQWHIQYCQAVGAELVVRVGGWGCPGWELTSMASNPLDHPQQSFCLKVAGLMGGLGHFPRVCLRGHSLLTSADEGRRCREWPTCASVWSQDSPRSQGFGATGWGGRPSIALSLKRTKQGRQRLKGREEVESALAAPPANRAPL